MHTLLLSTPSATETWHPTTLQALSLGEKSLEDLIAATPDLLGLTTHGIFYREARAFRQCEMTAPDGRRVRPDVLLLTDAGHVVVVEVKRQGNPGLFGRSVIAQVTDYAATFATLDEAELCELLLPGRGHVALTQVASELFPLSRDAMALGRAYADRFRDGDLTLVIACDVAPPGVREWIEAVASQSALAFKLLLIEITPWVCGSRPGDVLYVPRTTVETEIVSRTAVTVRTIGSQVSVSVAVDSAETIGANMQEAQSPRAQPAEALMVPAQRLGLSPQELWEELLRTTHGALDEDWSRVHDALAWSDGERAPYLRGKRPAGYREGRMGVDLVSSWKPGLFVGVMLDPSDHKLVHSEPELGPDFTVIVSVTKKLPLGLDWSRFFAFPEFRALRDRLVAESGGPWDVHDHLAAVRRPVRWHPIHLRRPLARVFEGCATAAERRRAWHEAARSGIDMVLRGGELEQLVRRLVAQRDAAMASVEVEQA